MALPLKPPVLPQLAKSAKALPTGERWIYEPKWDGFRCIAFVDGEDVELQSRNGRSLTRYFPELRFPAGRYVLDGEIVVFGDDRQPDFDLLGQRIHPAKSRVDMLAEQTPARFIAFDVLAIEDEVLFELPQRRPTRRARSRGCRAPRASSPRSWTRRTSPASASGCSRSSACARSTPSCAGGGRGRRRARSAR
jgi:ATP-dependent DNA ligase